MQNVSRETFFNNLIKNHEEEKPENVSRETFSGFSKNIMTPKIWHKVFHVKHPPTGGPDFDLPSIIMSHNIVSQNL